MSDEILDLTPSDAASFLVEGDAVSHSPFPLEAAERSVTIKDRGREAVHFFAPIPAEDWIEFERLVRLVIERDEQNRVRSDSLEAEATNWLWDKRIVRVEGYPPLPESGWKEKIWLRHKQAALALLTKITEWPDGPPDMIVSDEVSVWLQAVCNGQHYVGLRHIFRPATTKQQVAWSRANAQMTTVRGQRDGMLKHIVLSNLPFKLALYDELILRVEGYEPNDPRKMDALHKKTAIEALMGNG